MVPDGSDTPAPTKARDPARGRGNMARALEDVSKPKRAPMTQENIAALGEVLLWRILVEPHVNEYQGSVALAGTVEESEMTVTTVGRILQIGCFAFQSKTNAGLDLSKALPILKVGDFVLFEMYAGQEIKLRSGHRLRALNETDLLMRVKDPRLIRGYL